MKQRTAEGWIVVFCGILAIFLIGLWLEEVQAGGYDRGDDMEQTQGQDQHQDQHQKQVAKGGDATANSDSAATASNDGVTVEGDSVENNSSNVVLVPNNNTESCVRVIGIAFGKNGESGALGWPYRSKKCDFEQAADDAFAAGEREIGWFWKCHNKSLYRQFGKERDTAIQDCHARMTKGAGTADTITRLRGKLEVAENQIDLLKRHEVVCDESLMKCEKKLYGAK